MVNPAAMRRQEQRIEAVQRFAAIRQARAYWRQGFDTATIAERIGAPEAEIAERLCAVLPIPEAPLRKRTEKDGDPLLEALWKCHGEPAAATEDDLDSDLDPAPDEPETITQRPVAQVQSIVAQHFGLTRMDIVSARRNGNLIRPRQIAMYLAKQFSKRSLPDIGRRFERDHTTVMHALRKIEQLQRTDPAVAAAVMECTAKIERAGL